MSQTAVDLCIGRPTLPRSEPQTLDTPATCRDLVARVGLEAAVAKIGGPFAISGLDATGQVWAAVDRFGMETLCWTMDGDRLRVAPTADALAGPRADLDPQAMLDYLYFHAIPSPRTIYQGIYRLPPAHCISLKDGKAHVRAYWTPSFDALVKPSFDSLQAEFRELLEAAVRSQLEGSKPASFLSGGTDSSTVAGMAGLVSGRPADTYSIGFDAAGYDEMAYARLAAKHFGCKHHEYYVTPADLVQSIPLVAASYDQPFGNSSALPAYYCALMARDDGVTRILAGDGGDELFGGNTRYAKQRLFDHYLLLPSGLRQHLLEPLIDRPLMHRTPGIRKLASYVEQARQPMPRRLDMYNLVLRLGLGQMLTPSLLEKIDTEGPAKHQQQVWDAAHASNLLDRQLAFDWRYTLGEIDLPKVRGTTRLAGIEVGFPMLDQDLVDFSMRLPMDYKLRGQKLRWFFKEALRGFLPDEILTKKKQGFGLPFGVWANNDKALNHLASNSVYALVDKGLVQANFARTLLTEQLRVHPGYYGEMVWILMMLSQWLDAKAPDFRI